MPRPGSGTGAGPSKDQRYDAFPLGFNLTEDAVMCGPAANAYNYPRFYLLPEEGLRQFQAEEAEGKPLRDALAKSVGAVPGDRVPPNVIQNVKDQVVGKCFPHKMAYIQALTRAGVGTGFHASFGELAATAEDPENGEKYVRKNIRRYDYTRPKLDKRARPRFRKVRRISPIAPFPIAPSPLRILIIRGGARPVSPEREHDPYSFIHVPRPIHPGIRVRRGR